MDDSHDTRCARRHAAAGLPGRLLAGAGALAWAWAAMSVAVAGQAPGADALPPEPEPASAAVSVASLAPVVVTGGRDGLVGQAGSASEGVVTGAQLANRPLARPAELLEVVPGLVISQHSGDGKANQYYLRGFNLDHGTDFATSLNGMPLNQPTHAHGQGYTDLQFLIPELVERMVFRKGPYAADVGDFGAAGSAAIDYRRRLDAPFAQLTVGPAGYRRALTAGSRQAGDGDLLAAFEYQGDDGPWALPQALRKLNAVLSYSQGSRSNGWSVAAMAYQSRWNATDQVPQRALDSGQVGRYGHIDPTDGGNSHRYSLSGQWSSLDARGWSRANAYVVDSGLDLWSNFTYCLNDFALNGNCNRGDQFHQTDRRQVYGLNAARTWFGSLAGRPAEWTIGAQGRFDQIGKLGLSTTVARQDDITVRSDRVNQTGLGLYAESTVQWLDKFRTVAGLRADLYSAQVHSDRPENTGAARDRMVSPKLSLVFGPWAKTDYYINAGSGFHSNDARGATSRLNADFRDPGYLGPVSPVTPLVRANGYELGVRSARVPGLLTSLALWQLDLASELVFAGDAGTTAPSLATRRTGLEWSNDWKPTDHLALDANLALSRARYRQVDPALVPGSHVPGAIERSLTLGVRYDSHAAWTASLRARYVGARPLVEDNSVRSHPSMLVNAQLGLRVNKRTRLSLDLLNLTNRRVSDVDYFYASQLPGERSPVNDVHTHPAEPRALRLTLRIEL